MKSRQLFSLLFLIGILCCYEWVFGQSKFGLENDFNASYKMDSWNAETHDFSNSVLSFLQSKDGYIWLGTFDGLCELPTHSRADDVGSSPLNNNRLTEFPKSILAIKELKELDLSQNFIAIFPKQIRNFENLELIWLNHNRTDMTTASYEKFKIALKELNDKGVRIRFDYQGGE